MKLKLGDKLKCIGNPNDLAKISLGKVYEIVDVSYISGEKCYWLVCDDGDKRHIKESFIPKLDKFFSKSIQEERKKKLTKLKNLNKKCTCGSEYIIKDSKKLDFDQAQIPEEKTGSMNTSYHMEIEVQWCMDCGKLLKTKIK